jgi:serine/threonine-protein kinase
VNRLAHRIRTLADAGGPPDILAHSFGAWLVGQALRAHPDLRVGRVIVIGSVLRPDFDWATLVARGQAEAVLNQYGRRDRWVWATEFFIPGSGPAGLRGCPEQIGLINHAHPTFGHTTFFDDAVIDEVQRDVWRPFLTRAIPDLEHLATADGVGPWRPAPWLLRATVPRLLVLLAIAGGAVGIVAGVLALARALW